MNQKLKNWIKSELPGNDCDDEEFKSMVFMMILKMNKNDTDDEETRERNEEQRRMTHKDTFESVRDFDPIRPSSCSHKTHEPKPKSTNFERESMNRASARYRSKWKNQKVEPNKQESTNQMEFFSLRELQERSLSRQARQETYIVKTPRQPSSDLIDFADKSADKTGFTNTKKFSRRKNLF